MLQACIKFIKNPVTFQILVNLPLIHTKNHDNGLSRVEKQTQPSIYIPSTLEYLLQNVALPKSNNTTRLLRGASLQDPSKHGNPVLTSTPEPVAAGISAPFPVGSRLKPTTAVWLLFVSHVSESRHPSRFGLPTAMVLEQSQMIASHFEDMN